MVFGYECYGIIYKSSPFTCHMALELLLNKDYYIECPRLTTFSNTYSHHPDTLVHFGSKSYEWSDFFIYWRYQCFSQAYFLCVSSL